MFIATDSNRPQAGDRVAYLGRVSSPKQKLEHQREAVLKYTEDQGIHLPKSHWFEDKVRRHKQLTEGDNFNRLMESAKSGQFDWIIIATFDRWGITDKDDIFILRKQLRSMDVRLWSVADELEITGKDDASFWRVAARAEGATSYVTQQADKNIQKMISMAKLGLAGSGNAPYAIDLVCYPLISGYAPDLKRPLMRVIRKRYIRPALYHVVYYKEDGSIDREEHTEKMPLRDKKTTGYRYERSEDAQKLKAVHLIFESFDSGMNFGMISESLWKQGYAHYDKPFGQHGVESILRNPVYIGQPAWGKMGVGNYCLSMNGASVKADRKKKDPFVIHKTKEHFVQPAIAIWEPIIPVELWERVQQRLVDRPKNDPAFGMRRQKAEIRHPLSGKVICPECGETMVKGASMSKGYKKEYFICSTYRKSIRKKCHANSIPFDRFDEAIEELLATVQDRITALIDPAVNPTLLKEEWAKRSELGRILMSIVEQTYPDGLVRPEHIAQAIESKLGKQEFGQSNRTVVTIDHENKRIIFKKVDDLLSLAIHTYNAQFNEQAGATKQELADVEEELGRIALAIMKGVPSATVEAALNKQMVLLEDRKKELTGKLLPLTTTAEQLTSQLAAIRETIDKAEGDKLTRLLDSFVESVHPRFEGEPIKGHARPLTLEFRPREQSSNVLGGGLDIALDRKGKGSSPRPARTRPGTWCSGAPC